MSPAQQRWLALWAALLTGTICLSFLPLSRLVSILILLVVWGGITSMYRLFMRSSDDVSWTCSVSGNMAAPRVTFNEDAFFDMIGALLPD